MSKLLKHALLLSAAFFALIPLAHSQSSITSPAPGSQLRGSADTFSWDAIQGANKYSLWLGTAEDPDAYGRHNTAYRSMKVVQLPLNGGSIQAKIRWYDGSRWRSETSVHYAAAFPKQGEWGECTDVTDRGLRARLANNWNPTGNNNYSRGGIVRNVNHRINRLLRDGRASDTAYTETGGGTSHFSLSIHVAKQEKGIYLWLSPDSGAASVRAEFSHPSGHGGSEQSLILPYIDNSKPVFIALDHHPNIYRWLHIRSLDPERPVRISEIRMASATDDVSDLRKLRFSKNGAFVAANGDPRARVTAYIGDLFGMHYDSGEGYFVNHDTCGTSYFIDATWEIDQGVLVQDQTIWINFTLATNSEISAAIRKSVDYGEQRYTDHVYGGCTRAPDSLIYQDWLGMAARALNGSFDGPTLTARDDDPCELSNTGRRFRSLDASARDSYLYRPENLIDQCTSKRYSWSGETGTQVTLDAGAARPMQGLYVWSTFLRAENLQIESSLDGVSWRPEWSPAITQVNQELNFFALQHPRTRYVRITGQGSAVNSWVNLTEVRWVHRKDEVNATY